MEILWELQVTCHGSILNGIVHQAWHHVLWHVNLVKEEDLHIKLRIMVLSPVPDHQCP